MLRPSLLAAALLVALAASAPAQPPPVKATPLELSPNKPPSRALKVHFLPHLSEQVPGNAAPVYEKAFAPFMKINRLVGSQKYEQIDQWRALPLKDMPTKEVREYLKLFDEVLPQIEDAARHEYCDWDLSSRLRKGGIATLLPEVQEFRSLASLLSLKARCEMAEGRPEEAARTLQIGYATARHVGEQPTLINSLVGIALTHIYNAQLEALMQMPDCPCLYWAITDLPAPMIGLRIPFQGERLWLSGTFPALAASAADLKAGPMTEEETKKTTEQLTMLLREIRGFDSKLPREVLVRQLGLKMLAQHDLAKKKLVEQGRPADVVDKMPHIQVALLYALIEYDEYLDDITKLQSLPYYQAAERLEELEKRMKARKANPPADAPVIPLATEFAPAVQKVFLARNRIDRRFAALRVVEALRLYAAEHKGQLPESLADIKSVPVPNDPTTGKPFEYRKDGDKATLKAPPLKGEAVAQGLVIWYEVTIRK